MSDNPLIESFLKLQERLVAIPAKRATVPANPITDANRDRQDSSSTITSSPRPTNLNTGANTSSMSNIGATELQRPEVRRALGNEEKPTAGLFSGLKAKAEQAVADRREREAAERAGDLQTQRMSGREAEAPPQRTPAMNPRGAGGAGYTMNTGTPERIQPAVNSPKAIVGEPDRDRTASRVEKIGTTLSNLTVGSSGDDVKRAQEALGINADGNFGPQTKQAVMDFQRKHGLKVDGVVGDQTLSMMNRLKDLGEENDANSNNPFIDGFLKIHENEANRKISNSEVFGAIGKAHAGALKGVLDTIGSDRVDKITAATRGAADNVTMGLGKYVRAAVDTNVKKLGSLAGINEPTTFSKEIEQEREKDTAAQQNQPAAWDVGDKAATAAQLATGVGGVAKAVAGAVVKRAAAQAMRQTAEIAAKKAAEKAALETAKRQRYQIMGMSDDALNYVLKNKNSSMNSAFTQELKRRTDTMVPPLPVPKPLQLTQQMRVPTAPTPPASLPKLNLTPQMRVPKTPPLNLTPQMRVPGTRTVIPFPKNNRLTTEEQNDPSKGNTEMSTNPFIKGFFDIEEARAKNTNIFDESKKLTAAQKKHLDKNNNDKIDAEDFKMLRKEEAIEEAKKPKPGHNAMVMARNVSKVLNAAEQRKKQEKDEKPIEPKDQKVGNAKITKEGEEFKKRQSVAGLKKMIDDHDARAKTTTSPLKKEHHRKMSQQLRDQLADIKEEVEFSEEEMDFINSVMEAMPVAPTSEADSPNPTPKKKAEGSRAKGSMAD